MPDTQPDITFAQIAQPIALTVDFVGFSRLPDRISGKCPANVRLLSRNVRFLSGFPEKASGHTIAGHRHVRLMSGK